MERRWTTDYRLLVVVVSLVLSIILIVVVLSTHDWNPMTFVMEGSKFRDTDPDGTVGYDGQFVYYIARDPLNAHSYLDVPSHRYKRLIFPALAWLLSIGGNQILLPWVLIFINVVAVTTIGGAMACLLDVREANPLYALILTNSLGLIIAVRFDLNEPLAFALALSGLLVYERACLRWSLLLFCLAGLTKEVTLLFPIALACGEFIRKNYRRSGVILVWSIFPYIIWYALLIMIFRSSSITLAPDLPSRIPFAGIRNLSDPISRSIVSIWVLAPGAAFGLWALYLWLKGERRHMNDAFLVALHGLLLAFLPNWTWPDPVAILRVGIGSMAAILLWLASNHRRLLPYAAAVWGPSLLLLAFVPGML